MAKLNIDDMKQNIQALADSGMDEDLINRYIDTEGYPKGMADVISRAEAFENSKLGRAMEISGKITGFIPRLLGVSGPMIKTSDRYKKLFSDDLKGKNRFIETMKGASLEGLRGGGAAAGLVLGGVGSKPVSTALVPTGKNLFAQGAKSLLKQAATQAPIQATAGAVRSLGEGEDLSAQSIEDALTSGAIEGGINALTILGEPGVKKFIKEGVKSLIKTGSNVRNFAVDAALKDPSIILESQPSLVEIGNNISDTLTGFANKTKDAYRQLLDRINIPEGLAIDASKMRDVIKDSNIPRDDLIRILKSARSRELVDIDESSIIRFVTGGDLSFDEAKKLNSLLFDITNTGKLEQLGSGAIGRLGGIKKKFLDILDDQVPGIKKINRFYAEQTEFYDKLSSDIIKRGGDVNEGALNTIGQRLSGRGTAARAKGQTIDRLKRLDSIMGTNHEKQIVKSLAAEEFERTSMTNLMDYLKLSLGAGLGSYFGGAPGAVLGSAASQIAGSPGVTKKAIIAGKTGSKLMSELDQAVKVPLRVSASQNLQRRLLKRKDENNG